MSLLERQIAFRAEIAAQDDASPPCSPGMEIYRNAYRGRLLAALEISFERTRGWVGEEAFTAAACHFIIAHPPEGWTLDDYGSDFPGVLAALFAHDPEVAELAWLEWHMQRAFAAPDKPELDPAALASAGYSEADWANLRFAMAAGFAATPVSTCCAQLWEALENGPADACEAGGRAEAALLVWRSGTSPRYRLTSIEELRALEAIASGAPLAVIAESCHVARLGEWLSQWLRDGLFSRAIPAIPEEVCNG